MQYCFIKDAFPVLEKDAISPFIIPEEKYIEPVITPNKEEIQNSYEIKEHFVCEECEDRKKSFSINSTFNEILNVILILILLYIIIYKPRI